MGVVRGIGSGVVGAVIVIAGTVLILLQFGLLVGGLAYRKDCLTEAGAIQKSWTFTWLAPIPYLFRPSEQGCIVHTGTRVALNAIGVATFAPATPERIANHAAAHAPDAATAYWVQLRTAITSFQRASVANPDGSIKEGLAILRSTRQAISALTPPAPYASAHATLLAALGAQIGSGRDLRAAVLEGDKRLMQRTVRVLRQEAIATRDAVAELNRVHAAQ